MNYGAALRTLHVPLWQKKRLELSTVDLMLIEEMKEKVQFTPDAPVLQKVPHQFIFLYDELMRGRRLYDKHKEHSEFKCHGLTENSFHLWRKKLGEESFPIALEKDDPFNTTPYNEGDKFINKFAQNAIIKGEIHKVESNHLFELDKHYLNGVEFHRKKMMIDIPITFMKQGSIRREIRQKEVWMYVGIPEYWYGMGSMYSCYTGNKTVHDTIDGGYLFSPVKIYNGRTELPPYYYYAKTEGMDD